MSSLLERRATMQQAQKDNMSNENPTITNEYNNMWGGTGIKVEFLDPNDIELFTDEEGKTQPDRIQEEKVIAIMASAEDVGILQPCVLRLLPDGRKQVLSGRHRREAAIRLGLKIPCEIRRDINSVLAYKIMAESNPPGREKFPSELGKIFAKYLQMRSSGSEEKTAKEIATKFNVSEKTIYRYARLLELPQKLQDAIDYKIIPLGQFESILTNLSMNQLNILSEYIEHYQVKKITGKDLKKLFLESNKTGWTIDFVWNILNSNSKSQPDDVSDTSEQVVKEDLISKIHLKYPETKNVPQDKLTDLVLSLLSDYYE